MEHMIDLLKQIAPEFPLLIVFIIYNEIKDRRMQRFLENQRKEFISVLNALVKSFQQHDENMDTAIARMEERTRPRHRAIIKKE